MIDGKSENDDYNDDNNHIFILFSIILQCKLYP